MYTRIYIYIYIYIYLLPFSHTVAIFCCILLHFCYILQGKGDPEKAGKLEIATVLEVHKFMEVRMKSLVEELHGLIGHSPRRDQ